MAENLPDTNVGNIKYINKQVAIDVLAEQIALCDKALKSFGISMKDEYAVKVERASLIAYKEQLEAIPAADVVPVVHSRWKYKCGEIHCPECGNKIHRIDLSGYLISAPTVAQRWTARERSEQMVTMTLSFKTWCLRYHREIYSLLMFGHVELLTDDMKKEYLEWCRTDEGKKYLEGGEEYLRRERRKRANV